MRAGLIATSVVLLAALLGVLSQPAIVVTAVVLFVVGRSVVRRGARHAGLGR